MSIEKQWIDSMDSIILNLLEILPNGDERFSMMGCSFTKFVKMYDVDYGAIRMAEAGVLDEYPSIADEYYEEINLLTELFNKKFPVKESEAVKSSLDELGHRLDEGVERMSFVSYMWSKYSQPIRKRGEKVFFIWPAPTLTGSPIIKSIPEKKFISDVQYYIYKNEVEIIKLRKKYHFYRDILSVGIVVVVLAVLFVIRIYS